MVTVRPASREASFTIVAIAPIVVILAVAALVAINRQISSIRLDDGTNDERADSGEASDVFYNIWYFKFACFCYYRFFLLLFLDLCSIVKLLVIFKFFKFCLQSFNSIVVVAYNHFLDLISSYLIHSCSIVQVIASFYKSKFSLFLFALNLHSLLLWFL